MCATFVSQKHLNVMAIQEFIFKFNVKPADAVVLNKKFFGMVDHYVIYLGLINLQHAFVANYISGVKIISNIEIQKYLQVYEAVKVEKCPGDDQNRKLALKRAFSRIGQKAYNYVANNCEHFKNYVHTGIEQSTQVQKAGFAIVVGGVALTVFGASKKNDNAIILGIFIFLLGIIVGLVGAPTKEIKKNS
jgi:hypothetical protein